MRYIFFCLVCCGLLTTTATFAANRKVILLETMPVPVVTAHTQAILETFAANGDHDIDFEILKAEGSKDRAVSLLKKSIAQRRPALVITIATLATQAAVESLAGSDVPILFCVVTDPVGAGIINEVGVASGSNVSGVVFTQQPDAKIEMLLRLLHRPLDGPAIKIGTIASDYPATVGDLGALQKITSQSDQIELIPYLFPYEEVPTGVPSMRSNLLLGIEALRGKVDFLIQLAGPLSELESFTQILVDSGIPLILGHTKKSVAQGALMSVYYDDNKNAQQIVAMANQIFKGVPVGSLPVTVPRKFNLYLNLKTADKLGVNVPSHLLMIAGKNIIR